MFDPLIIFGAKYFLWILIVAGLIWFGKQSRENKKKVILSGLVVLPLIYIVSRVVAQFYYDPRPFVVDHFIPLIPHEPDNGFPSDHSLLGAAMAVVIYSISRKMGLVAGLFTILIGTARVLAGVHQPIDIAGSLIIAILVGLFTYHELLPRFSRRRS